MKTGFSLAMKKRLPLVSFSVFLFVFLFGSFSMSTVSAVTLTCGSDNSGVCINSSSCPTGYGKLTGGTACDTGYVCCGVTCSSQDGECTSASAGCGDNQTKITGSCGVDTQICCKASSSADTTSSDSTAASGSGSFTFQNPLKYDTVQGVLGAALTAMKNVIVLLALVFLVLGAILYVVSSGNEKMLGTAKKMILAAMIGLALGIAAPSFLKEIATILDWGGTGEEIPTEVQEAQTLSQIAERLLNFLLSMVGILGIVMIVVGGLMYFAAAGDEKRADTAKKIVLFAVIGVAVALSALIIVRAIANLFVAG